MLVNKTVVSADGAIFTVKEKFIIEKGKKKEGKNKKGEIGSSAEGLNKGRQN